MCKIFTRYPKYHNYSTKVSIDWDTGLTTALLALPVSSWFMLTVRLNLLTWSSPKQPVFKKIQQQNILWQHDKTYNPRFPQIQINKAPLEMDNLSILQSSVNSPLLKKRKKHLQIPLLKTNFKSHFLFRKNGFFLVLRTFIVLFLSCCHYYEWNGRGLEKFSR